MPLLRDATHALNQWRRNPGSTAAALFALSFGIAGTTTIFGIISAVLLQPLPVRDADRLVNIFTTDPLHAQSLVSMPDAIDLKQRLHCTSGLALASEKLFNMTAGSRTTLVHALMASADMFTLLGIQPYQGVSFSDAAIHPGQSSKVLLSWQFWQSQFGGRQVLGDAVRLDDRAYVIAGVLPKELDLPLPEDIWVPLEFDSSKLENGRAIHGFYAFARLRSGVALAQMNSELSVISSELASENPSEDKGVTFKAVTLRDWLAGDFRTPLFLLLAAVAGVLLMACANVGNLLLARSAARAREISIRVAVGATRFRLLQQLLSESLLLALCSAAIGLSLAAMALRILRSLSDIQIPRAEYIAFDWRVCCFAIGLACLTSLLFGILPALETSRAPVTEVLKQASTHTTASRRSQLLRKMLLTLETAIATVLLVGSVLLIQSFRHVTGLDPGFQTEHLLTAFVSLPNSRYGSDSVLAARFAEQVLPLIQAVPGVTSAAMSRNLPLNPGGNGPIQIEGRPLPAHIWEAPFVMREEITPAYRHTLNIPLLQGRDFDQREDRPGATGVLINQAVAQKYFPNQNPVGKRISYRVNPKNPVVDWHEIVGVIGDTRRGVNQTRVPAIFVPMYRSASPYPAIIVRTQGDPAAYVHAVEQAVHKVDPDVPCFLFRTMNEVAAQQLGPRAFNTSVLSVFTLIALVLASVGIFSVVAYSVSGRTAEIGLRMACGASKAQILTMIVRQGVAPAALGIIIGIVVSLEFGRYLESLLLGVSLRDPLPYLVSAVVLLLVSAAASLLPAMRAAAIDPWIALRYE